METLALFLAISCVITFYGSNPKAQGFSNLTLVRHYKKLWCIAQGEDAYAGLSWISPENLNVLENKFSRHVAQDCQVMRGNCTIWKGWEMRNSLDNPMPEVLDYRWNDLTLAVGKKKFNKNNEVKFHPSNSVLEMTLSILGKTDAYIYLCDSSPTETYHNCYWIILGGWSNSDNQIRFLQNSQTFSFSDKIKSSPLKSDEWIHVKVRFNKTIRKLEVFLKNNLIIEYHPKYPIDIKLLTVKSFQNPDPVYFRYHYYSYFWGESGKPLSRKFNSPNDERICLSIVYYIRSESQKGYLEVKLQYENDLHPSVTQKLEYTQEQWNHEKVQFHLKEKTAVTIVITGREGEYFAVGGIIECNPDGDSVISEVTLPNHYEVFNYSCQSLKYPGQKLQLKSPQSIEDCGADCTLNCKMFGISNIDCYGAVICKKIGNSPNACVCSSGYKDGYCTSTCFKDYYGINCMKKCENCIRPYFGEVCSKEDGRCYSDCLQGYRKPFCRTKYPYLKNAPSNCVGTQTSITVTVDNFEVQGVGEPIKYKLQYKSNSETTWRDAETQKFNISGDHIIQNLIHETEYKIRAVLIDESGEIYSGSDVPYKNCSTKCDYPAQENIKIETSTKTITVDWKVGEQKYPCRKKSYSFILKRDGITLESGTTEGPPFTIKNLEPFTTYDLKILYDNDVLYGNAVQTKEDAPSSPVNPTAVALSSQEIKVTWDRPSKPRGKLRSFKLEITLVWSGLKKKSPYGVPETRTSQVNDEQESYSYEVDDLLPASQYSVTVYGVTVSDGDKANTSVRTPMAAPKLGDHLQLKKDSFSNIGFQIILPAADKFLTEKSAYIIIVTSEGETTCHGGKFLFTNEHVKEKVLSATDVNEKCSWIAAEVEPKPEETTFVIGGNKTYASGGYYVRSAENVALVEGEKYWYQVTLVAVNEWENKYSVSSVKLEYPVQLGVSSVGVGTVVGWVILVLLLLCIPVVFFYIRQRRNLKKEGDQLELKGEDSLSGNGQNDVGSGIIIIPDMDSEVMPDEPALAPAQRFSQRIAIDDLEKYVKAALASGELKRQHTLFPRGQTRPWEYGQLLCNKSKNRYGKLAAYDETRVKLKKLPDDQFSDYINANYIDGYKAPKFYIATQGPKRNTVVDFWRMIWQEKVQVISMLANIFEDGKVKCEKYWPDLGQEVTHGDVTIVNASDKIFADFTFRVLNVSSKGKTRKVHHLHFTSWPDHSVPMYPQSVASYLKKLLAIPPGSGPIVVHCSAGVGRTGTIILADICLRMAAAEGTVDILGFLQQIREQRANLVDNLDQYKLVHLILLECLVTEPSCYPCDGSFEKRVQELINSGTVRTQFDYLSHVRWQDQALKSSSRVQDPSPSQTDPSKNRNLVIVPEPYSRVYISPFPYDDRNSDYINAVYVDGFRVKDQFIVTQFPLESTVCDFWRMIAEKTISLVVVLNEIDKSVCNFWPAEVKGTMKPMPHLSITKKQEDDSESWRIHTVSVVHSEASRQVVHILHLKNWRSDKKMPPSKEAMIGLWEEAERLYSGKEPIVVCCLDGATASGYFVALAFLIEKMKLEQQCDVCQAVRTVRRNREHFIPTYEQFESIYNAALTYLESFQLYSNFS